MVEQTFDDIRDSRCPSGDRLSCCGEREYELVDAEKYKSFFKIDSTKRPVKLTLLSLKDSDAGKYELKVKATLKAWNTV